MRADQSDREIDEAVLAEQDVADERQVGQQRNVEVRGRHDLLADEAGADQPGETDAENGERQTRRHLVDREAERERREDAATAPRRRRCRTARR